MRRFVVSREGSERYLGWEDMRVCGALDERGFCPDVTAEDTVVLSDILIKDTFVNKKRTAWRC